MRRAIDDMGHSAKLDEVSRVAVEHKGKPGVVFAHSLDVAKDLQAKRTEMRTRKNGVTQRYHVGSGQESLAPNGKRSKLKSGGGMLSGRRILSAGLGIGKSVLGHGQSERYIQSRRWTSRFQTRKRRLCIAHWKG